MVSVRFFKGLLLSFSGESVPEQTVLGVIHLTTCSCSPGFSALMNENLTDSQLPVDSWNHPNCSLLAVLLPASSNFFSYSAQTGGQSPAAVPLALCSPLLRSSAASLSSGSPVHETMGLHLSCLSLQPRNPQTVGGNGGGSSLRDAHPMLPTDLI